MIKVGKVHIAEDYQHYVEWFVDPLELDQRVLYVDLNDPMTGKKLNEDDNGQT
mgnify:CR=1 FL=1